MRGFFFFKDTSKIKEGLVGEYIALIQEVEHAPNQGVYKYSKTHKYMFNGSGVECSTFFGFVKYGQNYAGIPMLVNGTIDMAGLLNMSEGCCIIEVELGDDVFEGHYNNYKEITAEEFKKLYYSGTPAKLSVELPVIPDDFVTAIYTVTPVQTNILKVEAVFIGELDVATTNTLLYTDGCGNLYRPTDVGDFEECNDLLDDAVLNHGQKHAYGDMTFRIVKNVCNRDAITSVSTSLSKCSDGEIDCDKKLGDMISDDLGSDKEDSRTSTERASVGVC